MKLLSGKKMNIETRIQNNQDSNHYVAICVVIIFLVYLYLFTNIFLFLRIPSPETLFHFFGLSSYFSFESDGYIYPKIFASHTSKFSGETERIILFTGFIITFLSVYYVSVRYKKIIMVFSFLVMMGILYEIQTLILFLTLHLAVYIIFHPKSAQSNAAAFFLAFFAGLIFLNYPNNWFIIITLLVFSYIFKYLFSKYFWVILTKSDSGMFKPFLIRRITSHSVFIYILIALIFNSIWHRSFTISIGSLFFFLQWMRLLLYEVEYREGEIPQNLSLIEYMAVFFNPAVLPNWGWGLIIGQSYQFQDSCFLSRNKNEIVRDGIKLLGISLLYFLFGSLIFDVIISNLKSTGFFMYTDIRDMIKNYQYLHYIPASVVLLTCLLHEVRYVLLFAGIFHFLVGLWRLLGYDMPKHIDKPFIATNLISLWSRTMFHFREFLVKMFYYPVFLKLSGYKKWIRVVIATMATAGAANFIFGLFPQQIIYDPVTLDKIRPWWISMPYFILLGAGISLTEIYYLFYGRSKRKAWSLDWRLSLDIFSVVLVYQYYTMINIFYYAAQVPGVTFKDAVTLFLAGFGLKL